MDHLIPLPPNFRFVYQFSPGTSQYKCVEASLSMAGQIAYPDRYAHPAQLMSQIYERYVGKDVAGDRNGTTKAQALAWLDSQHIGHVDMQPLIDGHRLDELLAEIQAQNQAGIPQMISIGDESFLKYAKNGQTLHNWTDALNHGSHTFLRVGYSDSEDGWGYYYEPAAAPNFTEPVAIKWSDIMAGGLVGCIAVFPHGMSEWPVKPPKPPVPTFDAAKAELTLTAALTAGNAAMAGLANVLQDLQVLKGEM